MPDELPSALKNFITAETVATQSRLYEADCCRLADDIFDHPELAFEETYSSKRQADFLAERGFQITPNLGGMPTAFMAEAGHGGPVIGILGEFDALPAMSQEAGKLEKSAPADSLGHGHGCGHNLLGSASILAALTARDLLASAGLPGRIRYYGCPAEESGSGKTFMLRSGAFAELDAAFCWHPFDANFALFGSWMANTQAYFRFHGRSSHAAFDPATGRSALDALELMNIGVNFLREHMPLDCRIHYAITDAGGRAANIVQAFAEIYYIVRGPDNAAVTELFARVKRVAEGAAWMTETTMEMEIDTATSDILPNRVLSELMYHHLQDLGPPAFDEADKSFARALQRTMQPREIANSIATRIGHSGEPLCNAILPLGQEEIRLPVSGDMGDVSWVTPTAQCLTACFAVGSQTHTWQAVAQGKSPAAHKGMVLAANAMAASALSAFADPDILMRAREEWKRRGGETYRCPIPDGVLAPPLRPGSRREPALGGAQ